MSSNKELPITYKEPAKALITILRYALNEHNKKGDFIRKAMIDLGWWVNDEPNMCIPALSDAMWIVDPKHAEKLEEQLDPHLAKPDSPRMMLRALKGEGVDKKPLQKTVPPELALDPAVERKLEKILHKTQESSYKQPVLSPTFKKQESSTAETLTPLTL